jgi:hypothetical protein
MIFTVQKIGKKYVKAAQGFIFPFRCGTLDIMAQDFRKLTKPLGKDFFIFFDTERQYGTVWYIDMNSDAPKAFFFNVNRGCFTPACNSVTIGSNYTVIDNIKGQTFCFYLPLIPAPSGLPYHLYGKGSHAATFYDYEATIEPVLRFYEEFQPDICWPPNYMSGKANEIAETALVDWPGRPGTTVPDFSTYQVVEKEFMRQDEYDEAIKDLTHFIINKYIPRAWPGLKGLSMFSFNPAASLGTSIFRNVFSAPVIEALEKIVEMAKYNAKAEETAAILGEKLTQAGFPRLWNMVAEAPFDIIGDFFRSTLGMFEDQLECPDKIAALCDVLADNQIANLQFMRFVKMPVKRVYFPLHKGMDKFISDEQYLHLYWRPLQKIVKALIEMDITPFIYTEGPYDTHIKTMVEELQKLPPGKCLLHFEKGDFAQIKKAFSGIACISGGVSIVDLEFGSREKVVDQVKYLIDNCAPGGGYMLATNGTIEMAKRENVEAMFETARTYGKN